MSRSAESAPLSHASARVRPGLQFDWQRVVKTFLLSRALDDFEEKTLLPTKQIHYQFSARGHELGQILLGTLLTGNQDGVSGYYRSRPLLLTLGLGASDALKSGMAKSDGISDGRDIGVVFNLPRSTGPTVLPMAGGVGTQYTPAAGWAHAIRYCSETLEDTRWRGSIAVVLGGDGSVATNGFWAALNIAATRRLPLLFVIEDNGYGLSVPSTVQTPGGNIARNLGSFQNLRIVQADTTKIAETAQAIETSRGPGSRRRGPGASASEFAASVRPLRPGYAGVQACPTVGGGACQRPSHASAEFPRAQKFSLASSGLRWSAMPLKQ